MLKTLNVCSTIVKSSVLVSWDTKEKNGLFRLQFFGSRGEYLGEAYDQYEKKRFVAYQLARNAVISAESWVSQARRLDEGNCF